MGFREGLFVRLVSHFLTRFFTVGVTAQHSDVRPGIGVVLALLSLPGVFVSILLTERYSSLIRWLYHLPPVDYNTFSIPDKYMFVAYSMTVTGLVSVFMWDRLFPDRLDHANLAPLPLATAKIFLTKLVAMALFFTLFVMAINAGSGALFPLQVMGSQRSLAGWGRLVVAHMTATVAGGFFAFFVVFTVVGVLTLVAPRRKLQPISFAFQFIATIALILLLFATPEVEALLPQVTNGGHPMLGRLPTVWFLGLYQDMLGGANPAFHALAARAVAAFLTAVAASLTLYLASYRRSVRRIRESGQSAEQGPGRLRAFVVRWFDRYALRRPFDRACFHFAVSTLFRSRRHLLLMAGFAGLGVSIALEDATAGRPLHSVGAVPAATLLAAPLAILFFLLTGMRFVFDLPAELGANWTFQMAVRARAEAARRLAKMLMLLWIVPFATASLIVYGTIWGVRFGLPEAVFLLLAGLTLAEVLLVEYAKIPFTSSYHGPKHNAGVMLAFYLLVFFLFSPGLADLLHWTFAIKNPAPLLVLMSLLVAGWIASRRLGGGEAEKEREIVFADEPEPVVLTMDLK